jgi:hypothetical protein
MNLANVQKPTMPIQTRRTQVNRSKANPTALAVRFILFALIFVCGEFPKHAIAQNGYVYNPNAPQPGPSYGTGNAYSPGPLPNPPNAYNVPASSPGNYAGQPYPQQPIQVVPSQPYAAGQPYAGQPYPAQPLIPGPMNEPGPRLSDPWLIQPNSPTADTPFGYNPRVRDVPVNVFVQEGQTGRFSVGGSVNSDLGVAGQFIAE